MFSLIGLAVCFYAVLLLVVLYSILMGLRMCFEADTTFGVIATVLCSTVIFASPFFVMFWVYMIWNRNLAEELIAYLNRPKPVDDGR